MGRRWGGGGEWWGGAGEAVISACVHTCGQRLQTDELCVVHRLYTITQRRWYAPSR